MSATFYLPATENVQRTASVGQRTAEPGLNYLCKGYYQYFQHVAPYMDFMKKELMNQQAPANIMKALKDGSLKIEY